MWKTSLFRPPWYGVTKINFDVSFMVSGAMACFGAVMKRENGSFLYALEDLSIFYSVEVALCLAARLGLLKGCDIGLKNVMLEGDSLNVISYLKGDPLLCPCEVEGIILDCINICSSFKEFSFSWAKRSANMSMHVLAKFSLNCNDPSEWSSSSLIWLKDALRMKN